ALAARGLRFNHYTTRPICSPARAALLTGRNAHAVGTGWVANNHAAFPGYSGALPLDAATLAETLRAQAYTTVMVGKWHNTPGYLTLPSSPKVPWPLRRWLGGAARRSLPASARTGDHSAQRTARCLRPYDS